VCWGSECTQVNTRSPPRPVYDPCMTRVSPITRVSGRVQVHIAIFIRDNTFGGPIKVHLEKSLKFAAGAKAANTLSTSIRGQAETHTAGVRQVSVRHKADNGLETIPNTTQHSKQHKPTPTQKKDRGSSIGIQANNNLGEHAGAVASSIWAYTTSRCKASESKDWDPPHTSAPRTTKPLTLKQSDAVSELKNQRVP
jgi:hypothetical protein